MHYKQNRSIPLYKINNQQQQYIRYTQSRRGMYLLLKQLCSCLLFVNGSIAQVIFLQLSNSQNRQYSEMRNDQPSGKLPVPFSPKHSPIKTALTHHPLPSLVAAISKQQSHVLSTLSQKCSTIEYAIAAIEVLAAQMAERVQKINESREAEMLGSLKIKQSDFIIGELKATLLKQLKKQEKLADELEAEKRKTEKIKEENYKLESKNSAISQKMASLEVLLRKKTQLLESSNATIQKMRCEQQNESRNRIRSQSSKQSLSMIRSNEEYGQLQAKIQQLEKEFNTEIQKLLSKNNELSFQLKKMQDSNMEVSSTNKILKKDIEELTKAKYEIEIKERQQAIQMSELEESYSRLVEKSNNSEIMLHKQLQDYKVKEVEIKNQFKKEKKQFKAWLSMLAEHLNSSKYYFTAVQTKDQVEQLKKLHQKSIKKRLESSARELQYYQVEYKKAKAKGDQLQQKIIQIDKQKSTLASSKDLEADLTQKNDRVSENGSLLNNRSHDRSEEDKYKNVEEKYKTKLEALRKDIKTKQTKINDLEKMQQVQFDKNKEKILELQFSISEKTNEIRKLQLKFKEREYQFGEYQSKIKQLQAKIKFLMEKLQGEKESSVKLLEIKTQNYQEKLKIVKSNYKELQKKEQEKTIKYNKLKSKYEKYQLEASQSLKRKNAQIDQLLKENNKFKAQNKLLQQKININNIIESEISKNKTPGSAVNQDLIEQIQMERDRICAELAEKQKKYSEINEANEKLSAELLGVRKENRQLRNKIDEMMRQQRFLREENKYAKEKIEQLTKSNQQKAEQTHSYFKRQLEKSVVNVKKLEKACQKYSSQRQQRKKQHEQKVKQIQTLKINFQRLKQKRGKLQLQLQDQKQSKKRVVVEYERRLSQCTAKEEQLVDIINYKNRQGNEMRESMKGEQLIIEQQARTNKFNIDTMTDHITYDNKAINTDPIENESHRSINPQKAIIPSQLIFDNDYQMEILEKSQRQIAEKGKREENPKVVNYFGDLIMQQSQQDHFQICQEGEQALGRVSVNLQLKQTFNILRQSIEKVFNQEDISVSTAKLLPKQLQDDFNDLISYIKEKIIEIQNENNLTFIMAEAGNEPEDIQDELHDFISKPSTQYIKLRKIIEEKEYMITSLMNQKTEQENTINEQQNVQEEGERLHLQQYSVLKAQIHEQKVALDKQQLYYQSLKNIIKKMMNFWIQQDDNYDDFEDNLQLITTIYKFNSKQMELLKLYLKKYRELKRIE